jgi:hypothetical protein
VRQLLAVMTVVLLTWNLAPAAEHPPAEHAEHSASASADAHAPAVNEAVLPPGGIRWPGPMLLIVIGLFLAAAVIGPLSRLEEPEPVAPAHDDPGHGHDHGGGGHH